MDSPPHIRLRRPILSLTLIASVVLSNASAEAQTWQLIGELNRQVFAIAADYSDPNTVYVAAVLGSGGGLFRTTNLGVIWDTLLSHINVADVKIHPTDPATIYTACGPMDHWSPGILKSTDRGVTWVRADSIIREQPPFVIVTRLVIDPLHPETLFVGTASFGSGDLYKSTDGGMTWFSPSDTVPTRTDVFAIALDPDDPSTMFVANGFGIWRSTDGGAGWTRTNFTISGLVLCIKIESGAHIVHVGSQWWSSDPVAYQYSTDQGETWQTSIQGLPDSTRVNDLQLLPGQGGGLLAGTNRGVFSRSGNSTWQQVGVNGPTYVWALAISGSSVIAGSNDIYMAEIVSSIGEKPLDPQRFRLLENYPNPFNGETWIPFELPRATFVRVAIFDLLGRSVSILEESLLPAGSYKRRWDAGRFASGVYMCRMEAGGSIYAMKLALVR